MNDVLKSDIFFFITAIAVIVVGAVLVIALVYIIRILRDVKEVSGHVKEESENLKYDIAQLRSSVREEGVKWKHMLSMIGALFSGGSEKGRTRRAKHTNSNKTVKLKIDADKE